MTGWRSQFSMGNDQYPQTLSKATDILSNHKYDNAKEQKKKPNQPRNDEQSGGTPGTIETSFTQGNARTCYCCGETGHIAPNCPKKNEIPQDQWAANRGVQHLQSQDNATMSNTSIVSNAENERAQPDALRNNENETRNNPSGWSGV